MKGTVVAYSTSNLSVGGSQRTMTGSQPLRKRALPSWYR
jgi:hypothetical protein